MRKFYRLFYTSKFQLHSALVFTSNLEIHIVTCGIHLRIHYTSWIPYLFHSFPDFVVHEVTTLIFPINQRQCASFSTNGVIPFLLFKRAATAPNKLIDSQRYKRLRRKILITFHSLSNFTFTTTQFNLSFLKKLKYFKTIQRLALSFHNLHFLVRSSFKPVTNLELSNALAHVAKIILLFMTKRKCRDPRDPLDTLIDRIIQSNIWQFGAFPTSR